MDLSKERLLTLLELLQPRRRMSGDAIAERLEVTPRTVRRYILGLQEMGIPVEAERGRTGGYRMRPGFKLPPLMFTNEEALVLVLGLLAVERVGLMGSGLAVGGALAKLDRVLPDALRDRLSAAQETLQLGLRHGDGDDHGHADGETVLTLSTAARDGIRIRIRYRSARGEDTERLVDPYGIAFHGGRWYLAAWDHLREDLRTFRLDRLLAIEQTRESFSRPEGFDLWEQIHRSMASIPYPWRAEVRLEVSLDEARRLVNPDLGTVEPLDDAVLLRIGADDLGWIVNRVAALGVPFAVLSPPELRDAVLREAGRLAICGRG